MQPIEKDSQGVLRFRKNAVVDYLLDHGGLDMNDLARVDFPKEDYEQFIQLIGYSVSGAPISDDLKDIAEHHLETGNSFSTSMGAVAFEKMQTFREAVREPIAQLFNIHPDDLNF